MDNETAAAEFADKEAEAVVVEQMQKSGWQGQDWASLN